MPQNLIKICEKFIFTIGAVIGQKMKSMMMVTSGGGPRGKHKYKYDYDDYHCAVVLS